MACLFYENTHWALFQFTKGKGLAYWLLWNSQSLQAVTTTSSAHTHSLASVGESMTNKPQAKAVEDLNTDTNNRQEQENKLRTQTKLKPPGYHVIVRVVIISTTTVITTSKYNHVQQQEEGYREIKYDYMWFENKQGGLEIIQALSSAFPQLGSLSIQK